MKIVVRLVIKNLKKTVGNIIIGTTSSAIINTISNVASDVTNNVIIRVLTRSNREKVDEATKKKKML